MKQVSKTSFLHSRKRGAIEIQFNWLFVLIVGALILLFFTTAILRQRGISEAKIAATILTDLETITTGAKVSRQTSQIIYVPDTTIRFGCEDCSCAFSIGSSNRQFRDKVIFAPNLIRGRQVIAWTRAFSMPYRISNLLYLTSPQLRYIIRDNSNNNLLSNKILAELPDTIFYEHNPPEIQDLNNYKVRFTYIDIPPTDNDIFELRRMSDKDVSAIYVDSGNREVSFYYKQGSVWGSAEPSYWTTLDDLFGAFFAEDAEMYNCQMKELFTRMAIASRLYYDKATALMGYFNTATPAGQASCGTFYQYGGILPSISYLISNSETLISSFPQPLDTISGFADSLSAQNNDLILRHCPEIY